jgi:hypothetical protein
MASKAPAQRPPATKKRTTTSKSKAPTTKRAAPRKSALAATKAAPLPAPRRAIFVDVENTSSEADLLKVLEHLTIDRKAQPTELFALGNWKSVGARVARMLAGLGAQLVHSAPAVGVRDWSDLWIAVAAGKWLATAAPGDVLDIVSDDRAFDAVGDAAAAAGVVFRRTSYRTVPSAAHPHVAAEPRPRRRRRGGRGRRSTPAYVPPAPKEQPPAPARTVQAAPPVEAEPVAVSEEEARAASHAQISATLARLSSGTTRWINLDALATALKAEGFMRPPNSPRLVTRLRRMKDVEVSPNGMVRLAGELPHAAPEAPASAEAPQRRPRRRGGRGRRRGAPAATAGPTEAAQ